MLSQKSTQQKAYFALAWVSIFWGTTWLASKAGVEHMPALQLIGLRQLSPEFHSFVFYVAKISITQRKTMDIDLSIECTQFHDQ